MSRTPKQKMADAHEKYLVDTLGGRLTRGSGNQWRDALDGKHSPEDKYAFAWDAKSTRTGKFSVSLKLWEKIRDQAQGMRPLLPIRFYDDSLRVTPDAVLADIVVVSFDDYEEVREDTEFAPCVVEKTTAAKSFSLSLRLWEEVVSQAGEDVPALKISFADTILMVLRVEDLADLLEKAGEEEEETGKPVVTDVTEPEVTRIEVKGKGIYVNGVSQEPGTTLRLVPHPREPRRQVFLNDMLIRDVEVYINGEKREL